MEAVFQYLKQRLGECAQEYTATVTELSFQNLAATSDLLLVNSQPPLKPVLDIIMLGGCSFVRKLKQSNRIHLTL